MSLLSLPVELLSLILECIDTKELYPNCFLVCKTLLEALQQEQAWKQRCLRDLDLSEEELLRISSSDPKITTLSWQQVYRDHSSVFHWDPHHATLSETERTRLVSILGLDENDFYTGEGCTASEVTILDDPSLEYEPDSSDKQSSVLRINKRLVRWDGRQRYVSVRTKRPIRGDRCFLLEFVIHDFTNTHNFGVGFVTDNWDCRLNLHPNGTPKHSGWLWWNKASCSFVFLLSVSISSRLFLMYAILFVRHTICGLTYSGYKRHVNTNWQKDDVLGAMVDLRQRTTGHPFGRAIHFFKNGEWAESVSLPAYVECLWPVTKMYDTGDMVEVRRASMAFTLPPEKHSAIEAQLIATD
ncbi:hypothetical protein QOT17_003415 [Balamuthia mandrillaris]